MSRYTDVSKLVDGGPAFPTEPNTQNGFYVHQGMSVRDYFAGQALAGAFEHARMNVHTCSDMGLLPEEWAAKMAYGLADAMLAARERRS